MAATLKYPSVTNRERCYEIPIGILTDASQSWPHMSQNKHFHISQ